LYLEAIIDAPLAHAVPPVAHRSGTSVPQGLSPANVEALVASCDRRRSVGRRDQAILLLLARLGLRAREVAELRLDDIDWRAGEVVVRGKGRRQDLLPLPSDVGAAIVAYLHRGRPKADIRTIFLRVIAPAEPLSPGGITAVVYAACDRAGIPRAGAHRLRHTLATQTLRAGGSLDEVGELLRHAAVSTTGIYAKVDATALASLVLPWPGERS
jgi:site-specific recombinase XerD